MKFACFLIPLLFLSGLTAIAQNDTSPESARTTSLPVELRTTIRAEKARPGELVRFNMLEAVLVGNGIVIPADATIYGHILAASRRCDKTPSWLKIQLDRAQWKGHVLRLRGHIVEQIRRYPSHNQPGLIWEYRLFDDSKHNRARLATPTVDGVRIYRDKVHGITHLFSSESDLKLPKGVEFNLAVEALPDQPIPSTADIPSSTPTSSETPDSSAVPGEVVPASEDRQ